MKPTILFVYPNEFNPQLGGLERVTDLLTKELIERGYDVKYLNVVKSGIEYKFPAPVFYFPSQMVKDPINTVFYKQFLKEQKIDIVVNQDVCSRDLMVYLSRTDDAKVKYISVYHSTPVFKLNYFLKEHLQIVGNYSVKQMVKFLYRCIVVYHRKKKLFDEYKFRFDFATKNSDWVCLLSDTYKKDVKLLSKEIPNNLISIPNPLTYSNIKVDIKEKENMILFVGRLDMSQKRPDRIIKIWNNICRDYPNWNLYIVGDGPAKAFLEKLATQNKQIVFTGYQDPLNYYKRAKILCLTSNYEGWGMVLTECMACGVVPIAFKSFTAITDIISDKENGILIEPFKMKEYELQLRNLIENKKCLDSYAECGRQNIQKFNIKAIVDKWEDLFNTVQSL